MKILLDIGHPAHVHYFKNFVKILQSEGSTFRIVARNKEVTHKLLNNYNIKFINRGKGSSSSVGKTFYLFKADYILYKQIKDFDPDICLSFASPYLAQVSKLLGKPCITMDDTEHASIGHKAYKSFSKTILTPASFKKDFGNKHIRFNSIMEVAYMHPKYFKFDDSIYEILGIVNNEEFVLIRFVSWGASHDKGQSGLNIETKTRLVKEISKKVKIFISSENNLPSEFRQYNINISPHLMHSVLMAAKLYIGEGGTMASEAALLGTPSIYVNSLTMGYLDELEKNGLLLSFRNPEGVLEKAKEILNDPNIKNKWQKRRQKMLTEKIDITAFLVWFVENYPESVDIMKDNPDYQYRFK